MSRTRKGTFHGQGLLTAYTNTLDKRRRRYQPLYVFRNTRRPISASNHDVFGFGEYVLRVVFQQKDRSVMLLEGSLDELT